MNKEIYKLSHAFSAYIVACALAAITSGIIVFLIHLLIPAPTNEEIISSYVRKNGSGLFISILLLGLFLYRYTKKLNIVKSKYK